MKLTLTNMVGFVFLGLAPKNNKGLYWWLSATIGCFHFCGTPFGYLFF
jgi:hypothetical protein